MKLIALLGTIGIFSLLVQAPVFELVLGVLLAAPLLWYLAAKVGAGVGIIATYPSSNESLLLYLAVIGILLGFSWYRFGPRLDRRFEWPELLPLGVWFAVFGITLHYCHVWPDFFAMGERLRDYGLLAANVRSPVVPEEPWMSGAAVNYYVYWYRFGHMLGTLLGYPVWELYHVLVAFSLATYTAVIFRLLSKVFNFTTVAALGVSLAIAFGSNVAGVQAVYENDHSWWGPSRVIKGAINEFPAWSFLLGDLHPHYANLAALPFCLLLLTNVWRSSLVPIEKALWSLALAFLGHLFLFGANAWEIPMWWGVLVATLFFGLRGSAYRALSAHVRDWWTPLGTVERVQAIAVLGLLPVLAVALFLAKSKIPSLVALLIFVGAAIFAVSFAKLFRYVLDLKNALGALPRSRTIASLLLFAALVFGAALSGSHIVPEGGSLSLVRPPIEATTSVEMARHWGIPAAVIGLSTVCLLPNLTMAMLAVAGLAVACVFRDAILLLVGLGVLQIVRVYQYPDEARLSRRIGDAIVMAGLGLVLLPEFVFLDDPYGGENERMNTIFKIYTTAWFLMHAGAAYLAKCAFDRIGVLRLSARPLWSEGVSLLAAAPAALMALFFFQTADLRILKNEHREPHERGLSEVAKLFPGSKETVEFLASQPHGVVLETQGNAYDYTTFVTTLSGQRAYLGWANHVQLLTKKYKEIQDRERITDEFYKQPSCDERRKILLSEKIDYVVAGALEKKKYPSLQNFDFSCMILMFTFGDFSVYRPG